MKDLKSFIRNIKSFFLNISLRFVPFGLFSQGLMKLWSGRDATIGQLSCSLVQDPLNPYRLTPSKKAFKEPHASPFRIGELSPPPKWTKFLNKTVFMLHTLMHSSQLSTSPFIRSLSGCDEWIIVDQTEQYCFVNGFIVDPNLLANSFTTIINYFSIYTNLLASFIFFVFAQRLFLAAFSSNDSKPNLVCFTDFNSAAWWWNIVIVTIFELINYKILCFWYDHQLAYVYKTVAMALQKPTQTEGAAPKQIGAHQHTHLARFICSQEQSYNIPKMKLILVRLRSMASV